MNSLSRIHLAAPPWVLDLVTHLWQSSAVAVALLLLIAVCGRLPARTRCLLGWIALAKFALPAAWLVQLVERTGGAAPPWLTSDALTFPVAFPPATFAGVAPAHDGSTPPWLWSLLAVAWLGGGVVLCALWFARGMRVRRQLLADAIPASDALVGRVAFAAKRAGLRRAPRCVIVSDEAGVGVTGWWAPVVILPRGLAEALAPAELDAILIHECVHLQRRDNLWAAARAVFVAALWFNPVAWLLNRAIALETEKSCDERVLQLTGDAGAYVSGIVASVRHTLGIVQPGFAAATTPPVLARIKNILTPERPDRPAARWAALGAALALVALSGRAGSIAAAVAPEAAPDRGNPAVEEMKKWFEAPVTKPATPLRHYPAKYPPEALAAGKSGRVEVELLIDTSGTVAQARVLSSTDEVFEPPALEAVKRWAYIPAEQGGRPVFSKLAVPIEFQIAPGLAPADPALRRPPIGTTRSWVDLETEKRVRAQIDRSQSPAGSAPAPDKRAYRVGTITIKFVGPTSVTEQFVRSHLQMREGGEFDETTIDRDIRSLYRLGHFQFVEIRYEPVNGTTFNLTVMLTPKPGAPGAQPDGGKRADTAEPAAADDELQLARSKIAAANERLIRLRDERDAMPARETPPPFPGKPIYEIDDLDRRPVPRFQARPQYPFEMRRSGTEGEVVVDFIVNDAGDVVNPRAVRSSREEFEAAAVRAVSKWKFRPGLKGDHPVNTRMQVPIVFSLNKE